MSTNYTWNEHPNAPSNINSTTIPDTQTYVNNNTQQKNKTSFFQKLKSAFSKGKQDYNINQAMQMMSPELQDAVSLQAKVLALKEEEKELNVKISQLHNSLLDLDEQTLYQEFALYKPKYEYKNIDEYKTKLDEIRDAQKWLIKQDKAVTGNTSWTVNNSVSQGRKMVKDMQKLLLRAFNSECDELISRVTCANVELSTRRLENSCEAISKLGTIMSISISPAYKNSKRKELELTYEYKLAKQEEKEHQKEARERMREEQKLQCEIEEARKKIQKEQNHYQNALEKIEHQLETASETEKADILAKKAEIENGLAEIEKNLKDVDYREANAKAGYVYIISNIGAFGENVYKIGMTRRLDPQERIDELGDASVPFNFDVHAMIFSDDAPALEAALHRAFADRKLNMVNQRREFFRVSLDEIKEVVKQNFDKSVEFIEVPPAEQFRVSEKIKQETIA